MKRKGILSQSIETRRTSDSMDDAANKTDLDATTGDVSLDPDHMAAHILQLPEGRRDDVARAGEGRPGGSETTPLHLFGVLVGSMRRKEGLRLEDLAGRSGIPAEKLAAIELGAASFDEVVACLRPLGDALGDRYTALSRALAGLALY